MGRIVSEVLVSASLLHIFAVAGSKNPAEAGAVCRCFGAGAVFSHTHGFVTIIYVFLLNSRRMLNKIIASVSYFIFMALCLL